MGYYMNFWAVRYEMYVNRVPETQILANRISFTLICESRCKKSSCPLMGQLQSNE